MQGKWKIQILCAIRLGPIRLGQLSRKLPSASKKVLTENLRELESSGFVVRTDLGGTLRHVEYAFNEELRPALTSILDQWLHSVTPCAKRSVQSDKQATSGSLLWVLACEDADRANVVHVSATGASQTSLWLESKALLPIHNVLKSDVPFTTLYATDIISVQSRPLRELFLRIAALFTEGP